GGDGVREAEPARGQAEPRTRPLDEAVADEAVHVRKGVMEGTAEARAEARGVDAGHAPQAGEDEIAARLVLGERVLVGDRGARGRDGAHVRVGSADVLPASRSPRRGIERVRAGADAEIARAVPVALVVARRVAGPRPARDLVARVARRREAVGREL